MKSGIILVLLLLAPQCLSTSCRTCKDEECTRNEIPLIACDEIIPKLPFQEASPENKQNLQYGCLQLEYLNGNSIITAIQQCILTDDITEFCTSITKIAHVIQCAVYPLANTEATTAVDVEKSEESSTTIWLSNSHNLDTTGKGNVYEDSSATKLLEETAETELKFTDFEESTKFSSPDAGDLNSSESDRVLTIIYSDDSSNLRDSEQTIANENLSVKTPNELTNHYLDLNQQTTTDEQSTTVINSETVETTFTADYLKSSHLDEIFSYTNTEEPDSHTTVDSRLPDSESADTTISRTDSSSMASTELTSSKDYTLSNSNLVDLDRPKVTNQDESLTTMNPDSSTQDQTNDRIADSDLTTMSDQSLNSDKPGESYIDNNDEDLETNDSTIFYDLQDSTMSTPDINEEELETNDLTISYDLEDSTKSTQGINDKDLGTNDSTISYDFENSITKTQDINEEDLETNDSTISYNLDDSIMSTQDIKDVDLESNDSTNSYDLEDSTKNTQGINDEDLGTNDPTISYDLEDSTKSTQDINDEDLETNDSTISCDFEDSTMSSQEILDNTDDFNVTESEETTIFNDFESTTSYESNTVQEDNVHEIVNNLNIPEAEANLIDIFTTTVHVESPDLVELTTPAPYMPPDAERIPYSASNRRSLSYILLMLILMSLNLK